MNFVENAESYVFHLFKDRLSPDYIYHNFNHTLRVVNYAAIIAKEEGVADADAEMVILAAWFHDAGYVDGPTDHEERSAVMAEKYLLEKGYPADKAATVAQLIRITKMEAEPQTHLEKIIKDADCSHFAESNYTLLSELLREEWKLTQHKLYTDLEWCAGNRKMLLMNHRFYTTYGKEKLQPLKEANIASLQGIINELETGKKKVPKDKLNKKKLEKLDRPDRGIDTMFRVTLNNHTRLSEIADSKANILLSVNAIIISIALGSIIPKLDAPANAHLIIPTFVMMLFSTTSIVFAILSTRPKVTTGTFTRKDIDERRVNLLFFGNFYKMPLEEYEWAINDMMKDRDYLYNAMIKDLYFLGKVLNRKYNLLRITYNIFMVGILASVAAFVTAFWML
ncbi:Pycsar system effector family protein [Flavobacterium subsaxonicum]|uniref:Phosphohydrolase n=1 Tax=Flavobacterium subsaxonicum WB 4.1-42 = DSM 21790 TaxID=1121898 RepID=A0A0A2MNS5_9FLAO|nr:Pycsar system effector family protein [Flavobacterium subsaxonicum]KGO94332.1 phosphohydrolase [Flavobacterium subsaxonicum WB 4.1-42 = DSM 21790]